MRGNTARIGLVLSATAALLLEHAVPFGRLFLYPFTLLATWVHEMGHGVAALVSGGRFDHLEIFADASGVAYTASAHHAFVAAAGLIGPPLAGALILAAARNAKRGGAILLMLSAAILFSLLLWVRSAVGFLALAPLSFILAAFALWAGQSRMVLAQLVGVLFALDTVARIDYLFMSTAMIGGETRTSDISSVAEGLGGPTLLWGVLIAVLDFGLLYLGLRAAWAPAKD